MTDGTTYQTTGAFRQPSTSAPMARPNTLDAGTIAIDTWYAIWAMQG